MASVPVTRTFQPGQTMQSFPIPIVNDAMLEIPELFDISLSSSVTSAQLGPDATVLIIDDGKWTYLVFILVNSDSYASQLYHLISH